MGLVEWAVEYWQFLGGGATIVSVLAALPRIGPPIRGMLLLVMRSLPPVSAYRIAAETERANIEKSRAEMYRANLAELNEEVARLRASLDSFEKLPAPSRRRRTTSETTR